MIDWRIVFSIVVAFLIISIYVSLTTLAVKYLASKIPGHIEAEDGEQDKD